MNTDNLLNTLNTKKAAQPKVTDEKQKLKLQKAMQEFEAVFVNYLLKTMRKSVQKENEEESGFGGEMMQDMFDFEIAKNVSRKSSLGIGEMMYRQMTGEPMPKAIVAADASRSIGITPHLPSVKVKAAAVTAAVQQIKAPSKNMMEAVSQYDEIIADAAERHGVDSSLIKAVIATESAGNPKAMSSANAKGLMQLIDSTATMVGVKNVWDPKQNINGGTKYLKQLLDKFDGNVKMAVASYNAGPARVEKHKGIPPIPETQKYVKKVMQYVDHFTDDKK
ncbi:MAG: transglycosylase SLT domain-containing protein [Bacteroidota bacterium]